MVNLKALEAAITQVERIRDHELTFEAGGTRVTLRALRSEEETEIQRYAQVAWEEGGNENDQATFADFMDRLRHASLGFSVTRLGDLDLRGVEYIETGEVDDEGKPIAIPKWEAIRDLIAKDWSRPMLTQVFAKFGELLDSVDLYATTRVKLQPVDPTEEMERLQRRLEELRTAQANAKTQVEKDTVQQRQEAITNLDKASVAQREELRRSGDQRAAERALAAQSVITEDEDESAVESSEPPQAPEPPSQSESPQPS